MELPRPKVGSQDANLTQSSIERSMSEALGGFGGFLRCETCGVVEELGNPGARTAGGVGWPKCCGHTMRWWTQRQVDAGEVPPVASR